MILQAPAFTIACRVVGAQHATCAKMQQPSEIKRSIRDVGMAFAIVLMQAWPIMYGDKGGGA